MKKETISHAIEPKYSIHRLVPKSHNHRRKNAFHVVGTSCSKWEAEIIGT